MKSEVMETAVCAGCGYPLRGLPEPICPECGKSFDPQNPQTYGSLAAGELFTMMVRIFALWLLVQGFAGASGSILVLATSWENLSAGTSTTFAIVSAVLQTVTIFLAGVLFLWKARRLSTFFYGQPADGPVFRALPVRASDLYRVGAQLLGVYYLLIGLPTLTQLFVSIYMRGTVVYRDTMWIGMILSSSIYLGCSLYLIFGAKRIAGWLGKIRYTPPDA